MGIIPQNGIPTFLSIYRFMYGTTKKKSSAVLISVLFFFGLVKRYFSSGNLDWAGRIHESCMWLVRNMCGCVKCWELFLLVKSGAFNCNLLHSFDSMLFVLLMRIADTVSES